MSSIFWDPKLPRKTSYLLISVSIKVMFFRPTSEHMWTETTNSTCYPQQVSHSPWKVAQKQQGRIVFQPPNFQGLFLLNFRGCQMFNRKLYDHQVCQGRGAYACGSLFPSDWPCLTRIIRRGLSRSLSFIFLRFKVGNSSCHQEVSPVCRMNWHPFFNYCPKNVPG